MAQVLVINSNPKKSAESVSLTVANEFFFAYQDEAPDDEIIILNLYDMDLPEIDQVAFAGWGKLQKGIPFQELAEEEKNKIVAINRLTEQFVQADKYVFITPMWNFGMPPRMKAYIDTICIAGKTFRYTKNGGSEGLMTDRKAVHIQARGGTYSEGPMQDFEFGDRYMRTIFKFMGIKEVYSVIAEGVAHPNKAESAKNDAFKQAEVIAQQFARP